MYCNAAYKRAIVEMQSSNFSANSFSLSPWLRAILSITICNVLNTFCDFVFFRAPEPYAFTALVVLSLTLSLLILWLLLVIVYFIVRVD